MNSEIRRIWDEFERITAWFNGLELDNNKGPLTWMVDKYTSKVDNYIASWEEFDKLFKTDFNQMKLDISKLVHWQEWQRIEMIHYHENFMKFTTENKLLWAGFEENWESITKAVKEGQDQVNWISVEAFDWL